MSDEYDYDENRVFKIIFIGESGCGKTSIIKRYCDDVYSEHYRATIGVDFSVKKIQYKDTKYTIQVWDVGGQERFGSMTRIFYKKSAVAFIVFDLTNINSFNRCKFWKDDIEKNINTEIFYYLIGNKSDLDNININDKEIKNFCEENNFHGCAITSAKTGQGVNQIFETMLTNVHDRGDFDVAYISSATIDFMNKKEEKTG